MDLQGIGSFILVVGGLVLVHELGHFAVAKWLGVKVLRFSIGFGPRLLWFTLGDTEYRVSALPLGGYVKMAGDVPGEEPAPEDRGRGFYEQRPWKRVGIGLAGPAANFLFPILLFTAMGLLANGRQGPAAVIGYVLPGSAADRGGLQVGDRVVTLAPAGEPPRALRWWGDLVEIVSSHPAVPLVAEVDRAGARRTLELVPDAEQRWNSVEFERRGVLGIVSKYPPAMVAPSAPGAAGPLEPFDEVTRAGGASVEHFGDLARAFAAAACRPVDLVVRRGPPGAAATVELAGVPTCAGDRPSVVAAAADVSTVVAKVEAGGPAAAAGLARGDVVTSVDGRPIRTFDQLEALAGTLSPGAPIELALAGGRTVRYVPRAEQVKDPATGELVNRYVLGFDGDDSKPMVPAALVTVRRGVGEIAADALAETWHLTRLTAVGIGRILTGRISHRQVGGIIELATQSAAAAAAGLDRLLFWMALVSVNLGLMNLLPIPVLDGGHVAAAVVEQVTRRPLSMRVREVATYVGLVLLGLLMILAFRNDIARHFL